MKLPAISPGARHMLLASFYFAMMNIFVKAVSHLPSMEVVFFRCGISLLMCLYFLRKENVDWRGSNRKLLILRGAFGTAALYAYFITIAHMPLGTAVTIQYLSPIFTTILAIFVLSEKVKPLHWVFFMVSFGGILLIKGFDEQVELKYLLIGILSAFGSACAYVTIRSLKEREHPLVVVLHFQMIGTLTGLTFSIPTFIIPSGVDWISLILVGVFTQLGQVNMTKSLQMESVAKVSILNYTGVIYAMAAGYLLFSESYPAGSIIGILMVIGGVAMSMIYRNKN